MGKEIRQESLILRIVRLLRCWMKETRCPRCRGKGYYEVFAGPVLYPKLEWRVCQCEEGFFYTIAGNGKLKPARKNFLGEW